jgi:hypothetical protein
LASSLIARHVQFHPEYFGVAGRADCPKPVIRSLEVVRRGRAPAFASPDAHDAKTINASKALALSVGDVSHWLGFLLFQN